jgi:hypothetical protein
MMVDASAKYGGGSLADSNRSVATIRFAIWVLRDRAEEHRR